MDVFVELKAVISDFMAKMATARGEMAETSKSGGSSLDGLGKASGAALAAVAAGVTAVGVLSVKMAMDLQDAHRRLAVAITDTGGSITTYNTQIAAADKQMEKFGFTNAETQDALAVMTTGLGSPTKALGALGIAADLASMKHVTLAQAGLAVTKALEGNMRPLHQLGIDLPIVASSAAKVMTAQQGLAKAQAAVNAILAVTPDAMDASSKAHGRYETAIGKVADAQQKLSNLQAAGKDIMTALAQKIGGQAADAANTFSGRLNAAKARAEDLLAALGLKLIPVLERLITIIMGLVGWFEKHAVAAKALAIVIGTALVVATVAWVASLSPLILIAAAVSLAVVGLAAAGQWLARNWTQVAAFMQHNATIIATVLTGGIGGAAMYLYQHWTAIWGGMETAVNDFVGFFTAIPGEIWNDVIMPIWNDFAQLPGDIVALFENVGGDIIRAIERDIPGGGLVAKAFSAVGLAEGGLVTHPTLAVVGEAGPELVVPLSTLRGAAIDASGITRGIGSGGAAGGAGGAGGDLVIQLNGQTFARVAGPVLLTWLLQNQGRNATRGHVTT